MLPLVCMFLRWKTIYSAKVKFWLWITYIHKKKILCFILLPQLVFFQYCNLMNSQEHKKFLNFRNTKNPKIKRKETSLLQQQTNLMKIYSVFNYLYILITDIVILHPSHYWFQWCPAWRHICQAHIILFDLQENKNFFQEKQTSDPLFRLRNCNHTHRIVNLICSSFHVWKSSQKLNPLCSLAFKMWNIKMLIIRCFKRIKWTSK